MADENAEFDPFEFSTGFIDDVDVEVLDAYFGFDPLYNNGQSLRLHLNVRTDDEDFGEMGVGDLRPYSVGEGWSMEDKGAIAVRDDGANKAFNRNSGIAKLVASMLDCDGAEAVLRSEGRGDPRKAEMYKGLKFHMKSQTFDYGGEIGKRDMLLAESFLGVAGGGSGPAAAGGVKKASGPVAKAPAKAAGPVKKAPAKAAAPAAAPAAAAEAPPVEGSEIYQQMYDIAWNAESHEKFVEACYENVPGIMESDVLAEFAMDKGEGSLWAKVVADYEAQS